MQQVNSRYKDFVKEISLHVDPERIFTDRLRRHAWGTDASFYHLVPSVVVYTVNEAEAAAVISTAAAMGLPVTFRAAGTSLSGQSVSDSILLVANKAWEGYRIVDEHAHAIALQPGITGAQVDEILKPYGRYLTTDPASKKAAMIGGIVANNASGMKCGVHANSERVLSSVRIVLYDGTVLDTADEDSRTRFAVSHPEIVEEISKLRREIIDNRPLYELIKHKYSIKNVTGLNILPFIEFEDPFDIIAHLMVGSEGTLAFMSEITMLTAPIMPYTASAMLYFDDMTEACRAVVALRHSGSVQACELLDKKSLAAVGDTTGKGLTALLLQAEAATKAKLDSQIDDAVRVISAFRLFKPAHFSSDPVETAAWWQMRSGVFPAVGGTRPLGTTALIEDVAFHIDNLPEATVDLAKLIEDCGYDDACIYGHALEGNYHFVIAQSFETKQDIDKYHNLMDCLEKLVVERYNGSLKAEHGTGRNVAPFVKAEWGAEVWEIMKRVKRVFDPNGIFNPGVIFNDDPDCFIQHLKHMPQTNEHVDRCIECGFCEPNCVSACFTMSARQRIAIARQMTLLEKEGNNKLLEDISKSFGYYGIDTCAGDGLCSTSCPMGINTGLMIHDYRQQRMSAAGRRLGKWAAWHLPTVSSGLRFALATANIAHSVLGNKGTASVGRTLNKMGMPLWSPALPKPFNASAIVGSEQENKPRKLVYFPSCINRTMGVAENAPHNEMPLPEVFVKLCRKAGFEVIFPKDIEGLCCGMIWESKGMPDIAEQKIQQLEKALAEASQGGTIPVVCDQSPCLHRMRQNIKTMRLYEPAEFIYDFLAPYLDFHPIDDTVAVHITCSSRLMGIADKIVGLAAKCAAKVVVPKAVGCCGFAGDKGFTHPELNRWALRKLKPQIDAAGIKQGFSNSRTCEIGLTTNSGIPYKSIVYLVDNCTTQKE